MKSIFSFLISAILVLTIVSCKNDKASTNADTTGTPQNVEVVQNDSKALEGTGAKDISNTYKLDQTQIVQDGNRAFHFKSKNSMQVYVKSANNDINFDENEVFAIFAEKTIKETSFKVEGIDTKSDIPTLNVSTIVSTKTVPEYRPSFVVTVPKSAIKGMPVIRLDSLVIPTTGMQ